MKTHATTRMGMATNPTTAVPCYTFYREMRRNVAEGEQITDQSINTANVKCGKSMSLLEILEGAQTT